MTNTHCTRPIRHHTALNTKLHLTPRDGSTVAAVRLFDNAPVVMS